MGEDDSKGCRWSKFIAEETADPPKFSEPVSPPSSLPHEDEANDNGSVDDASSRPLSPKIGQLTDEHFEQASSIKPHVAQAGGVSEGLLEYETEESGNVDDNSISELLYGPSKSQCFLVTTAGGSMRRVITKEDGTPERDAQGVPLTKPTPLFELTSCVVLTHPP